jgi:hypothetical protein
MLALGYWLKTRTRFQRITLVLVAVAGFNRMLGWTTGYEIIGGSLLEFSAASSDHLCAEAGAPAPPDSVLVVWGK